MKALALFLQKSDLVSEKYQLRFLLILVNVLVNYKNGKNEKLNNFLKNQYLLTKFKQDVYFNNTNGSILAKIDFNRLFWGGVLGELNPKLQKVSSSSSEVLLFESSL